MHSTSCCLVCGKDDRRALTDVVIGDSSSVVLCGSHALMVQRAPRMPHETSELRRLFRERRSTKKERRAVDPDVLAVSLHLAFSGDRRNASDRRSGIN